MTIIEILNRYNWTAAEVELITNHFDEVMDRINNLPDETFDKLFGYFNGWLMGETPKARLNYWMKKTNTSVEMLNIWATL